MSRVAVITGGGSGIGRAVCEQLGRDGHRVAVLDIDRSAAKEVTDAVRTQGSEAVGVAVDVADRAAVDAAFAQVHDQLGPVDILVTSAALTGFVPFGELTDAIWDREFAVNVNGVFYALQAALPDMVAGGWGRIVTISSVAGVTGSVNQGHYSATKGAVIALTKTIALEHASSGITANTIPPFTVDTPGLRAAQEDGHLPPTKYLARAVPMGRLGTVEEIAATCGFLCSDAAGYLTGQVISVNGGAVT